MPVGVGNPITTLKSSLPHMVQPPLWCQFLFQLESRKQESYLQPTTSETTSVPWSRRSIYFSQKRQVTQNALGQIFTYTVQSESAADKLYLSTHTYTSSLFEIQYILSYHWVLLYKYFEVKLFQKTPGILLREKQRSSPEHKRSIARG